jgi:hypothetical protein
MRGRLSPVVLNLKLSLAPILLALPMCAAAAVYYLAPNGNDTAQGSIAAPWQTIAKANSSLAAGDTLYLRGGVYQGTISPSRNGAPGSPIMYCNYNGETVTISNVAAGILMTGKRFVTISGINVIKPTNHFFSMNTCTNCTITNCVFIGQVTITTAWTAGEIMHNSCSNLLVNCTLGDWGGDSGGDDYGSLLWLGDESSTDLSFWNRVEGCTFYHGGHDIITYNVGRQIIRNNYFHNEIYINGKFGNRIGITMCEPNLAGQVLFESNYVAYASPPADLVGSAAGVNHRSSGAIFRRNFFYDNSDVGLKFDGGSTNPDNIRSNHVYQNTFYNNGIIDHHAQIGLEDWDNGPLIIQANVIVNNLFRHSPNSFYTYGCSINEQTVRGNFSNTSDPLFANTNHSYTVLPDFRISSNSPCVDAGVFLTVITSPTGSGTSFVVADSGFFQDGWGGITPDSLQLQGQSAVVSIVSINRVDNTITFKPALTWTNGQGVSLPYSGRAPDQGAVEWISGAAKPPTPTHVRVVPY